MALQHQDVWAGQGLSAFGGGEEGAGVGLPAALPSSLHAGGVVTRGLSALPGTVRKVGFQRALLPRAKSIAGTHAAVQTPLQWNLSPQSRALS